MKFYNVGKIVNTHGIRGEVRVIPTTDFVDERFAKDAKLYLANQQGEPLELTIESSRPHKGSILVKFDGYDNINDVEKLRRSFPLVPMMFGLSNDRIKPTYCYPRLMMW